MLAYKKKKEQNILKDDARNEMEKRDKVKERIRYDEMEYCKSLLIIGELRNEEKRTKRKEEERKRRRKKKRKMMM